MRVRNELKIMGINPFLISTALAAIFALLATFGGNLLYLSCVEFEVIFPFFTAIAVGEWGKTKSDDNFDVIAAQGKSLFQWVLIRYFVSFAMVSAFALLSMFVVFIMRNEMPLLEMLLIYLSPALFLSTLSALFGVCFSQEHISTLICGVIWLITMLVRSLLRFPGVEYIYLFIRHAGDSHGIWLVNKALLLVLAVLLWVLIYFICTRKEYDKG